MDAPQKDQQRCSFGRTPKISRMNPHRIWVSSDKSRPTNKIQDIFYF